MAGYKPQRKLYVLKFTDDEFDGLEITAGSASMGTVLEIQSLGEQLSEGKADAAQSAALTRRLVQIFVQAIKSWNLEDEAGKPLPIADDSLLDQDPEFVTSLLSAWTEAVSGVSVPLDGGSPSGATSLEASIPMDILSKNHPN